MVEKLKAYRVEVYRRDNYKCQDCGVDCIGRRDLDKTNSHRLIQCHHIEDYKNEHNNNLVNLVTLCVVCHAKRHERR
ncbi:hypothetical protein LCGC14_1843630 [marine sediment metagenome]|uniref:HNH domain-containing protein n=1 Tax=marine sediment metagenome TaxID=412755 RepID=A0A0F9GCG0_9ZZZZ